MKKNTALLRISIIVAFIFSLTLSTWAQGNNDTITATKNAESKKQTTGKIKKGLNFEGLPIISFDSDLGLQLGALGSLFNYGDGSRYPRYNYFIFAEASFYTRGSSIFMLYYDSDKIIDGIRLTANASYIPDLMYAFYGFNGYESTYKANWIDDSTEIFYRMQRNMTRFMLSFQGRFLNDNLKWFFGADYYLLDAKNVNINHFNKKRDAGNQIPNEDSLPSLYQRYQDWGLITPEDRNGGKYTAVKVGLIYDTRDNEPNPNKGMWSEVVLIGAPKFLSTMESGFSKISIIHRQYFTIIKDNLTFAYRLGFIATIGGHTPWYAQNRLYPSFLRTATSEGLGGGGTMRGILRNRVVGDAMGMGNFEFRWKFFKTVVFNQNIYLALSGFFDTGRVFVKMEQDKIDKLPENIKSVYFTDKESFHNSLGAGIHIAINQNFIVAVDWGKALDERDGTSGLYIGLNFLF